jgi:hypothetical protein
MFKKATLGLMITIISIIAFLPYTLAHDLPSYNLSDYITPYDNEVIKLAETIGLKPFLSYPLDNTRNAYYWVSENIKYMHDEQRWGARDYWQLPSTTVRLGTGDCEDQAILLTSLLRALKLPRENVRLVIGPTERGTYHAWVEIKIPLPIYGLETIATHAIELLENKKVTISIGEVSYDLSITSATIAEMKTKGLSQRDGWIPLDTTAKLFGLPIPFSWWLTYGYNVYTFLGCKVTPDQMFQDKARIWEESKELGTGGSLSFDIPCVNGDRIVGVAKAINAWKTQILEHIQGMDRNVGWSGPFYVRADEKMKVEWSADRAISVYILTESQFKSWTAGGVIVTAPSSYCMMNTGTQGAVEYVAKYSDNFYAVLWLYPWGYWGTPARVYDWKISKIWQETTCNVQVSASDPEGKILTSISIRQREVEQRFDFTAGKNGIYKVVLINVGESAPIYVRLEEFSTPLSPEVAGISENLVLTEQEYADKFAQTIEENSGGGDLNVVLFSTLIFIFAISAIAIASFVLLREKKAPHSARVVEYDHEKVHAIKIIPEFSTLTFAIFISAFVHFCKELNRGVEVTWHTHVHFKLL